jgi:peptide/nickel transport system permease protein
MTGMLAFVGRHAARLLIVLFALVTVTFFVSRTFGDPVALILPIQSTDEQRANLRADLGLDRPVLEQYGSYLGDLARGDFGDSIWQHRPTVDVVLERIPATLVLAGATALVATAIGVTLGMYAGARPGSRADRIVRSLVAISLSIPDFWFAIVLVLVVAVRFDLVPTSGYGDFNQLLLPVIALSLRPTARVAGVVRESVATEMTRGYVLAARAKGMGRPQIFARHVVRNVAVGALAIVSYDFIAIFTGTAMAVETVFAWPGIGSLAIQASLRRDVTLLSTLVIVIGTIVALVNMVVEIISTRVDRRLSS